MYLEKKFYFVQIILLIVGLVLSLFYAEHQILTGDQTQMLYKGYMGAINGNWISYGNAASVVGNVPGSMTSYFVGIPLMMHDSPWSPMLFLIFLHLLSYLLLDNIIKNIFKNDIRLVFLVMYWLNPWLLFESTLYNPSYLFFFSALHLWTAYKQREKSSFVYSFLHLLSIGLALQFHYSWLILGVLSLYLLFKKIIKINWYGIFFALLVIIISLVPYAFEFMKSKEIRHNSDPNTYERYIGWGGVHVYPVFKAMLYWIRYDSFMFPNKLIASANFDWLGVSQIFQVILQYIYKAVVFSIGIFSIYVSYRANKHVYGIIKNRVFSRGVESVDKKEWLLLYTFGALFGLFISAILSPIIFSYWHLIIVFPFAIIPFLYFFEQYSAKYLTKFIVYVTIYFIFINLIGAIDSRKFSFENSFSTDSKVYIEETIQNLS